MESLQNCTACGSPFAVSAVVMYNLLAENISVYVTVAAILLVFGLLIFAFFLAKKRKEPKYTAKDALLTPTEIKYYDLISEMIGNRYLFFPQINLASIINKESDNNSRTDLFRNIDFGVFDYNFKPILLIEINDNSHFRKDRIERDEKVAKILKKAKLPLLTLWVKDGIDPAEIYKKLSYYLNI